MEQDIDNFFWLCVRNPDRHIVATIQPENMREFLEAQTVVQRYQKIIRTHGIDSKLKGVGDISKNGFDVIVGFNRLSVLAPSTKPIYQKKGVSDTSLAAYASLDKAIQAAKVAAVVVALHKSHPFVSDSLVAKETGLPSARISARRAELETAGGVLVDGVMYRLEYSAKKEPCPVTGNRVQMWRLVNDQLPSVAVQTSLFQV